MPNKLEKWKKLANEATPGPWRENTDTLRVWLTSPIGEGKDIVGAWGCRPWDIEFIAASREAVPMLIECLEKAIEGMEYSYEKMGVFLTRDTSPQASAWFNLNNVIREIREKLEQE